MTHITAHKFEPNTFKKLRYLQFGDNWPVVYMLENGSEMYIGQTKSATTRLSQHYKKPERKKLHRAHILLDGEYNLSATIDIESKLIQYIAADGKYKLQNSNAGLLEHEYYDREKYTSKFELIWKSLQEKGMAKNDLIQIRNTDLFKFSPYKALTEEQIEIVKQIHADLISEDYKTHLICGGAGTGKSVLATYLAKYIVSKKSTKNLEVALVIPMTSLRKTLQKVFSKVDGLSSKMVIGPTEVVGKNYDLLIVDEAHRLRRRVNLSSYGPFDKANAYYELGNSGTQLDWVLKASKSQVFLFDENQNVVPGDVNINDILSLPSKKYELNSQMRVMAGNDYIDFIENIMNLNAREAPDFGNYELKYFSDLKEMIEQIIHRDEEHGLARVVAGYAWSWKTKNDTSVDYDIELDGLKLKWNSTNTDWVNSANAINEVGCIHTVQGYDLNYVGVIIGPELYLDKKLNKLSVDKKKYMDFNGKRAVESTEELERYVINIYKTLLTRGIKGTFIHAVDPNLAEYLQSKVNLSNQAI